MQRGSTIAISSATREMQLGAAIDGSASGHLTQTVP
jgi:hypothetical protein